MSAQLDSVRSTFDRFAAAWKTNDSASVASFFTEDGVLINPFGQRADGRPAVAALYTQFFGGMLKGTSTSIKVQTIRPVENDHAFVDSEQTVYAAGGKVLLAVHLVTLMRREGDTWRYVDARPYVLATPPV